ncbi:lipopolysaccharide biosynthesis protein [Micromonospora sp. KC606]|uniref:lipopolysaccharide biosynthesis protein n=1 Tax=Micromonospora sp. KC606 TaxID=2530379 RepID=UPI001FB79F34|nr:lipopolysaccharide biosynthesis protein [Micromonospora sp. KC606]
MEERVVGGASRGRSVTFPVDRSRDPRQTESVPGGEARAGLGKAASGMTWSLLGLIVAQVAQWAVMVLLSRLGTPEMVGQYALGLAVGAPVILLAGFGLRTVQVTDTGPLFSFNDYLRLRTSGMVVALLLIGVIAAFVGPAAGVVVLLVGVAKALDAVGDIYWGLFQRHERMRPIAISMISNGLISVLAVVSLLVLTGSIGWAMIGSVIGSLAGSVGYCARAAKPLTTIEPTTDVAAGGTRHGPPPDRPAALRRMARLAVVAAPLGLASGLVSLSENLPRYLAGHLLGTAALGIFAALAYIVLAANVLFAAISQLLLPRLTRLFAAGDVTAFTALTLKLILGTLCCGAVVVAVVIGAGPATVRLVYGAPYDGHAVVLILLTIAAVLRGAVFFLNTALYALRKFGNQLVASMIMVAVAGSGGYLLIPRFGLVGAAWSVIITASGDSLLKALMLKRALAKRLSTRPVQASG